MSDVVDLDSGSDSDSATYKIETRRHNEYPRVAKKSTMSEPRPPPTPNYTTRRQVALAKAQETKNYVEIEEREDRKRQKYTRRVARRIPGAFFDEDGIHIMSGLDLCDCLQKTCPGCFFPCRKCGSQKCGPDCRSNRKYVFDEIDYHGYDYLVKNPFNSK